MEGKHCVVQMEGLYDDFEVKEVTGPYTKKEATEIANKKNLSDNKRTTLANGHWESCVVAHYKKV